MARTRKATTRRGLARRRQRPPRKWETVSTRIGPLKSREQQTVFVDLGRSNRALVESSKDGSRVHRPPQQEAELQVQFDKQTGRPTWVGLLNPEGLTPTQLQRFPWARFLTVANAALRGLTEPAAPEDVVHLSDIFDAEAWNKPLPKRRPKIAKRPGRAGHPEEHFVSVAKRYAELVANGVSSPTMTIARERHVSRNTAAGWVSEARKRSYLLPAHPGRAG